ncbi:NAD(P)-dependent alcohol dehydrogenase [Planomonospora venezuelensis]|uniref:NADPH:quinone reductase-like Zn-dependent oxidoreductase n=1 Tax=Planomonospora venezuelensis TaxID=1999 RepID=A0A841CSV1_PLAVE|nr:NAD(P)-dependent alcohol dehydrogenase [Planomonospora venezuelensis]MBB5960881.1 NADPH:quinone reductase-like Zn-dependent oxidoreductase [Planomonospora venezuelensis]GIN01115.1 NADPH:quinone reductase [Planomonospora venezuelensis]
MKAIIHNAYGSAEVLHHADVDKPVPGDDQVLVRVRAASVNYGDRVDMHGSPAIARLALGLRRPRQPVLGRAVAGTVEAVGAKVTGLRVGDEVLGQTNKQGFAEYVAVAETRLAVKPPEVTFAQAATLPIAATTALQGMRLAEAGPGRTVLVNGASGALGTFAVQLAGLLGAEVTGVCSTRNAELVRSIGAHHVIDYTREDLTRGARRFDAVFDLLGNHPLSGFRRVLNPKGVYIASHGNMGTLLGPLPRLVATVATSPFVSQRLRVLIEKPDVEGLAFLAGLVAAGKLAPVIQRTYPLSETADAIHHLETEHARGKIVLTV